MTIPPRYYARFIDGRLGPKIKVAFLPGALGAYLHTLQTDIEIEPSYAIKLLKRRMNYWFFNDIQATMDNGHCMLEDNFQLSILYVKDKIKPEIYFLLVKTDRTRTELWSVTFHRLKQKQFSARLKPSRIIRHHAEDDFME